MKRILVSFIVTEPLEKLRDKCIYIIFVLTDTWLFGLSVV